MRKIRNEWQKIWNGWFLFLVLISGLFIGVTIFKEHYVSYQSMETHGIYGSYQKELFDRYGITFDEKERIEYNLPNKIDEKITIIDQIIATETVFKEQGIKNFEAYNLALKQHQDKQPGTKSYEEEAIQFESMLEKLTQGVEERDDFFDSPLVQLRSLESLKQTHLNYDESLQYYQEDLTKPLVAKAAKAISEKENNSTLRYDLLSSLSSYLGVVTIFSLVASVLLVAPYLAMDRSGRVYPLQYVVKTGRKIVWLQYFMTLASSYLLTVGLFLLSFLPLYFWLDLSKYWEASILSYHSFILYLYEWTLGQASISLIAISFLIVTALVSFTFVIAYFSQNILTLVMKLVPFVLAFSLLVYLIFENTFSNQNQLFEVFFQGRIALVEMIVPVFLASLGILSACFVCQYEKKTDKT